MAARVFKNMASTKVDAPALDTYLDLVFPKTANQKKKGEEPERWTHVRGLFERHPDLQLPGVQGTLWAAYNAITYFEDHKSIQQESAAGRLDRVWFGGGADVKLKALAKARELIGTN
jgi:hypothetical protein